MTRTREPGVDDDAALVAAARSGERDAFAPLVERYLDRCWAVALRILHDHQLAADVAQEALLTSWQQLDRLQDPAAFGGWVLRIARNRALDRLERERRAVPTGDLGALEPDPRLRSDETPDATLERAAQRDLVWAAAAALGERDASLLDLHLRHGLGPSELAAELGVTPNAAHQAMFKLRGRLGEAIRAFLLWRDGTPSCVALDAELVANGSAGFDAATARAISRHAEGCAACERTRARATEPAAMFAAVPLLVLPAAARAEMVRALGAAGVPVRPPSPDAASATGTGAGTTAGSTAGTGVGARLVGRGAPRRAGVLLVAIAALLWLGGTPTDDALVDPTGGLAGAPTAADGAAGELARPAAPSEPQPRTLGGDPSPPDGADDPAPAPPAGRTSPPPAVDPTGASDEPTPGETDEPTPTEAPPASDRDPEEPGDLPVIDAFVVRATGQPCRVDGQVGERASVTWSTTGADAVTLRVGAYEEPLDAAGQAEPRCLPVGSTPVLEATNAAGTVTATA